MIFFSNVFAFNKRDALAHNKSQNTIGQNLKSFSVGLVETKFTFSS